MKPPRFQYFAPRTLDEACSLLTSQGDGAKVLAGGQSLIPLLNFRLAHPEALVDINRIADLAYLRTSDGGLAIGALTRQHAVERSELVRERVPVLAEACHSIGHLPIRHRGTIGGNLAHADPASELPAVMIALEAQLTLASVRGTRIVPAHQFFVAPLTTALVTGELLTEIRVPAIPARTGGAFVEMARRAGELGVDQLREALDRAGAREHPAVDEVGRGAGHSQLLALPERRLDGGVVPARREARAEGGGVQVEGGGPALEVGFVEEAARRHEVPVVLPEPALLARAPGGPAPHPSADPTRT